MLTDKDQFSQEETVFPTHMNPCTKCGQENSVLLFSVHLMSKEEFKEDMSGRRGKRRTGAFIGNELSKVLFAGLCILADRQAFPAVPWEKTEAAYNSQDGPV